MVSMIEVLRAARRAGRAGDVVQSCSLYARVLSEDPQHAEALHFYGLLQDDTLGSLESLAWVERSLRLSAGNAVFFTNKALALQKRHAIEDSIESLRCALAAQADYAQAFLALGHARKELKEYSEAVFAYEKALILQPDAYPAYEHLSFCYEYPSLLSRRLRVLQQAHVLAPDAPDVAYGLGLYRLLSGEFAEGWDFMQYRWQASHIKDDPNYSKPLKLAAPMFMPPMKNSRVFIWSEQGIGDEIMFYSLLPEFAAKFDVEVVAQADSRLLSIWQRSLPDMQFIERSQVPVPHLYQSQLPSGDLPRLLRRSMNDFESGGLPFIKPDPIRQQRLQAVVNAGGKPVIGVSWHSTNGASRCVPLADLVELLDRLDVVLINLQYGDHSAEISNLETKIGHSIFLDTGIDCRNDIEGLAALVSCCDLVISIGNSTVHLAGALGVKTWALLPFFPGWRWLHDGEKNLWYRSVRLLRQHQAGDWSVVLNTIKHDLNQQFFHQLSS